MDENTPVSLILLDTDLQIVKCNSFFLKELQELRITCTPSGSILKYIPEFVQGMTRIKTIMHISKKTIYCIVSHYLDYVFIEQIPYTKALVRFSNTELKPALVSSIEDNMLLSRTKLSPDQKRYNEQITKNNVKLLKTLNNTTEYLKLASGLLSTVFEDVSIYKVIEAIKKLISVDILLSIKRDVIINTDFKKMVEMLTHILQYQIDKTSISKKSLEVKLIKDTLKIEITDYTGSLSKYQKETLFHGFIHNDIKTDHLSLMMPIARGISICLGGSLDISDTTKSPNSTTYIFSLITKDIDSD